MDIISIQNPFSGQTIDHVPVSNSEEVKQVLQNAQSAFQSWRRSSAWDRSQLLHQVGLELEKQKEEFAQLICQEAGKPIQLARTEVNRGVGVLNWASAEAQRFSGELLRLDVTASGRSGFGIHTRFPRGIILGITPFNFPLNLVLHKVAPAIACGCSIIIKPSPYTPLTALKLKSLFDTFVPYLVQVLIPNDSLTAELTHANEIAMISFTGSAKVGSLIRKQAPEKHTTLELGGNAWVIVLEDTPDHLLPGIARKICNAAYGYAGQSCISVQNVAIESSRWNEVKNFISQETEKTPFGNPQIESVVTGPVINPAAADRIRKEINQRPSQLQKVESKTSQQASTEFSTLITPTLFLNEGQMTALQGSSVVQQEIFAPVMTAHQFNQLDTLIHFINSSTYGLQAGVFTQQWDKIQRLFNELEVGGVVVNDVPTTRYDHQPYGGVKDSGQGREGIKYAMEDMTESKFLALSSQI